MLKNNVEISIEIASVYLGEKTINSQELATISKIPERYITAKLGLNRKYISIREKFSDIAVNLAKVTLKNIDLDEINVVVWTGAGKKDYPVWSASSYIINKLSLKNAWGFDLFAQSAGSIVALRVCKNILQSDDKINKILLIGAHNISNLINYSDKETSMFYNFSDGADCILISRCKKNLILESDTITNGQFSNDVIIKNYMNKYYDNKHSCKFILTNEKHFKSVINKISIDNYVEVIKKSISMSSQCKQIKFIGINHMGPLPHREILSRLNLSDDVSKYLNNYGHVGCADPLISLYLAENDDLLTPGDLICLSSAGLGYTWSATCIEWSEKFINLYN